ncbi:MAG: AAA family ATPase [Turicibacter sp.]
MTFTLSQFIRSMELKKDCSYDVQDYPFNLPAIKNLERLNFHQNVTFIVGENGSGKSTLLEAIAVAYGFNPEGGSKNFNFSTMSSHSDLNKYIRLSKGTRLPKTGFFLRAETFYNLASQIEELDRGGIGPRIIESFGGVSLHEQSHGEAFFSTFMHRFSEKGIYILDEPEAALSPARQLTMLARIHDLVNEGCQFIIATHSPILMAYPQAIIYEVTDAITEVDYMSTDHYQITKNFLNAPERFLDILMED